MLPKDLFAHKAEKYARYRWDYAPQAIETLLKTTGMGKEWVVADIGAGPGSLAKHLLDHAARVILVEPDPAMRRVSETHLGKHPAFQLIDASAESTTLPTASVDLITVGQALHYFEPEAARQEFKRILKPGGWLAVLRNYGTDEDINAALEDVYSEENGCNPLVIANRPPWKPLDFYFEGNDFQKFDFPCVDVKNRAEYIDALSTASYAPDEDHPLYEKFAAAAGEVFDRFNTGGKLENLVATELYLGHLKA